MRNFRCLILLLPAVLTSIGNAQDVTTARIARGLKGLSDSEWTLLSQGRAPEAYEIVKGDTLYDISKRLFGDAKYWPKIWAINNKNILNPHLIYPGNRVLFYPGDGSTLPTLGIQEGSAGEIVAGSGADSSANEHFVGGAEAQERVASWKPKGRSKEWKKLPRQPWEFSEANLPKDAAIDPDGFDRRSKIRFSKGTGMDLPAIAASEPIASLGTIKASRSQATYLFIGDTVFIDPKSELQVGESYAIVAEPTSLKAKLSGRSVLSYPIIGRVKVVGVKDGLFIGSLQSVVHYLPRGASLTKLPERYASDNPLIPSPTPVESSAMTDRELMGTGSIAQHKYIFFDRGADDGVRPGMVFRVFQHDDPKDNRKITDADYLVTADAMVTQVSERACLAVVIKSNLEFNEQDRAVLLTDVTDVLPQKNMREKKLGISAKSEIESIENNDVVGGGPGPKEASEIEQLERWQKNKAPVVEEHQDVSSAPVPPPAAPEPAPVPSEPEASKNDVSAIPQDSGEPLPPLPNDAGLPEEQLLNQ